MAGEYINDEVRDQGLDYFAGQVDIRVDITSQVATTYGNATTSDAFSLGNKTGLTAGATVDGASGRKVQIPAITDGSVTTATSDTATHWAVSDVSGTALIATGPLTTSEVVTNGNTFTLDAIDIQINDATVT